MSWGATMDDGHGPFVVGTQQEEHAAEETKAQQPEPVQVNPEVEQIEPKPRRSTRQSTRPSYLKDYIHPQERKIMSLDLESMLKAILESQERVISRSSTSCERAYEPTTSLEYQPHGDFGQGHQYRYGERHQPWDLEYEEEEDNFPQDSNEEDITNMLEKLLENQERGRIEMERQLDSLSNKIDANGKALSSRLDRVVAHVKS
ncbi:hypothetical protein F2Q69_00004594 [Brassica cretica]|uniref:Uncharacterized protein n=1 Tax=Brassica cretica TaxID=69181 RepID=A0A8S9PCE8_BRACR|nr:hypothetical protein F2Q69_00004594 [Brassica cretica]